MCPLSALFTKEDRLALKLEPVVIQLVQLDPSAIVAAKTLIVKIDDINVLVLDISGIVSSIEDLVLDVGRLR